jgi:hypothetical protein
MPQVVGADFSLDGHWPKLHPARGKKFQNLRFMRCWISKRGVSKATQDSQ